MILICPCIYLLTKDNSDIYDRRKNGKYQIIVKCPNCGKENVIFEKEYKKDIVT